MTPFINMALVINSRHWMCKMILVRKINVSSDEIKFKIPTLFL